MRDRFALILPLAALLLGAFLFWALFCRGESEELRRQIDDALAADSVSRAENVALKERIFDLVALAANRDTARKRDSAAVDSLKSLPPRVRIVHVQNPADTAGPLIPIEVVEKADFDTLQARCDRLSGSCAATIAAKNVVIDSTMARADSADARADRLAARVAAFTVPRDPPKWAAAVCTGYGGVYAEGNLYHGPSALVGVRRDFNPLFFLK